MYPRRHQVRDLRDTALIRQLRHAGVGNPRVLAAMAEIPRHLFVPPALVKAAYADSPLPIGHGQTISQPLMVAVMLEALELKGHEKVLDVGGGSGYQAALLGWLAREVWSIEIVPELARDAERHIARAGVTNVHVVVGDGSEGYAAEAPYDAIVVAAASPDIPRPLVDQLAPGGRLVLPVGMGAYQALTRVRRRPGGTISTERLELCSFVPLRGRHGVPYA